MESDNGQSTLPGVHSGSNAFGAAGPMQIGIGGAAGNNWGGAPVHPASEAVSGVATDADGDGIASVYDPADAIAGTAKILLAHGVLSNVSAAIFAYNHLESYVQAVESYASTYASGGYSVTAAAGSPAANTAACVQVAGTVISGSTTAPNHSVAAAIAYAQQQIGKPYLWGGTGPDAFDCSGLVMMAYQAAGVRHPPDVGGSMGLGTGGPGQPGGAGRSGVLRGLRRYRDQSRARRAGHRRREDDRGLRDRLPDPGLFLRHQRVRGRR